MATRPKRQPQPPPTSQLSERGCALYAAVVRRSSDIGEQVALITTLARTVGASTRDMDAVRELVVEPATRECGDRR